MNTEDSHRAAAQRSPQPPQANRADARPSWQLPPGVSPGTWDYVRNQSIATQYELFLDGDPLAKLDRMIVDTHLPALTEGQQSQWVVEFGCGNGRTLIPLMQGGYHCVGVDLSIPMLRELRKRWNGPPQQLLTAQANLVDLGGMASDSVDHAVSMFSTLGMVRGAHHRAMFLKHARRIIRPGGTFILHAHHVWQMVTHQGGMKWLVKHLAQVAQGKIEFGDRFSDYRGIRNMFIHSFRKRALQTLLGNAGFEIETWYGLTRDILDRCHSNRPIDNRPIDNRPIDNRLKDFATSDEDLLNQMLAVNPRSTKTIGWVVVCR